MKKVQSDNELGLFSAMFLANQNLDQYYSREDISMETLRKIDKSISLAEQLIVQLNKKQHE